MLSLRLALVAAATGLASTVLAATAPKSTKTLGCYSAFVGTEDGQNNFQSIGFCGSVCSKDASSFIALTNGNDCLCGGTTAPEESLKVDDTKCDTPCSGYAPDMCGGKGFFTVVELQY